MLRILAVVRILSPVDSFRPRVVVVQLLGDYVGSPAFCSLPATEGGRSAVDRMVKKVASMRQS